MALTNDRNTMRRDAQVLVWPVEAATVCFAGGIACLNASGKLVPGRTTVGLNAVGCFSETVDNSTGDKSAQVRRGCFNFNNSTGADEITLADVGAIAYIVDDERVAKTDGTGTRSKAGVIRDVDSYGVWIEF
jgi:hypothetical protein